MPVLALYGAPFPDSWQNAAVGIYMACVPLFLGHVCFGYALARIPASTATTTITLLEPVVAAALAAIIVGEQLTTGWAGRTDFHAVWSVLRYLRRRHRQ